MKRTVAILALFLIMFVVACQQQQQATGPFVGGVKGLTAKFLPDLPPDNVYDQGHYPFEIHLEVENKGEYDVDANNATISIAGVEARGFGNPVMMRASPENLAGVKKDSSGNIIPGTKTRFEFPGFNYVGSVIGDLPITIYADLCYLYGTKVTSKLCVKKDMAGVSKGVCTVEGDKTVYSSGAPVKVTSLRESNLGSNRISFTFTIKHVAEGLEKGSIIEKGSRCSSNFSKRDKMHVKVDTGFTAPAECSVLGGGNAGFVTLSGGERVVTCKQNLTATELGDYEKPIDILLLYDYEQRISKAIVIKHLST